MTPSFGHHLIPLLPLPGAAGALGGKVHLPAVKAACKSAERIQGVLTLAGRFELAVVPDTPDFFDVELVNAKARNHAWETIRETQRLQWVIPTRRPDLITSSLPPTWVGKGFQNVCIGYMADSVVDFAKNLQALRNAPLQHRMLLLNSASPLIDLEDHLKGIGWVVFTGNPDDAALAGTIGSSCRQAGASFLFHQSDGRWENVSTIGASEDGSPWPTHPFGTKIDLSRPTLPDLKTISTSMLVSSSSTTEAENNAQASSSAENENTDSPVNSTPDAPAHAPEPLTDLVKFEVVPSEHVTPESDHPLPIVSDTDHDEFDRLNHIVLRGISIFKEVGNALAEIRDRALWRAGGYESWAAYCLAHGLTKTHANRLINSSAVASHITQVTPIGVTPMAESQVRPLCKLKQPEQQVTAWSLAAERANGQPTAKIISDVVAELMALDPQPEKPKPDLRQLRIDAFSRLRDAFHAKRPKKEIELRLAELKALL